MATVKSIDIALRANTTQFEAGMRSGMGTMNDFSATTAKVNASMDKAWHLFNKGAIQIEDYNRTIQKGEADLQAISHGFNGMVAATQRAQSVLMGLETETDRYNRKLRELNALKSVGALKEHEHAAAVKQTQSAMQQSLLSNSASSASVDRLGVSYAGNLPIIGRFTHLISGIATPVGVVTAGLVGAGVAVKTFSAGFHVASEMVQRGLERIETAANAADQLGMLTTEFQRLEYVVGRSDIAPDKFVSSIQKMNKNISAAISGNDSAAKSFSQLRVNVEDLSKMSPGDAFTTLIGAIEKVESPFHQSRLAVEVFGKSGGEMIRIVREGSKALEELKSRADSLRLPTDQLQTESVKEAQDAIYDLKKAWEGLENTVAVRVSPVLTQVVNDMTKGVEKPQESLNDTTSKWKDIASAIALSSGPLDMANRLSTKYFDNVNERAAIASNATQEAAKAIQDSAKVDPSQIEDYMSTVDEASKRQQEMAKATSSAQQKLLADQRTAAQEQRSQMATLSSSPMSLAGVNVPRMPAMNPLDIGVRVDTKPLETFEAKFADLTKKFESGAISKPVFIQQFEAAKNELQRMQEVLKQVGQQQLENARIAQEAEKALSASRIETLKGFLTEQREEWKKNNPGLAAYDALIGKVAQLNDLNKAGLISEKKRDELIAIQAQLTKSTAVQAQEELNKKILRVNEAFRAGLLPLQERNRLLSNPGKIGDSKVFDEASKKLDDMKSRSKSITEAMQSPLQKLAGELTEIRTLERLGVEAGGIDRMTAMKAEMEARQRAMDQMKEDAKKLFVPEVKGPAAVTLDNQSAAFSAFQQAGRDVRNIDEKARLEKQMARDIAKIASRPLIMAPARGI